MLHDVVIIGTGPAGVSAAWPLVQAGLDVLLVDASVQPVPVPPTGEYFDLRRSDRRQGDWMFGADLAAWLGQAATSPKLRVPTLRTVFADFTQANRIETANFAAIGSLASGGLSNAWGCGVARYDRDEMAAFPFVHADLQDSFAAVSRRIGLSGRADDALSDYFGLDDWADAAPPLDENAAALMCSYEAHSSDPKLQGLRLGRARLAVLSTSREDRKPCDLSGLCLWGCARGSLYSAGQEVPALVKAGARLRTGIVVDHVEQAGSGWRVNGIERKTGQPVAIDSRRVVLAAGTLATTAIAWRTLGMYRTPGRLLSNPTAAFLLLRPAAIGRASVAGPAFAQLSFAHRSASGDLAHGALFSPGHLPSFEFIKHVPTSRSVARSIWRLLGASTLVGNAFMPAKLADHEAVLTDEGVLRLTGRPGSNLEGALSDLARTWRAAARRLGFIVMPGSFRMGQLGSDIHYAGTLPMREDPAMGQTTPTGELAGMPGLFVADAATFPELSAKPHTLTMMAIADRLGRHLAGERPS
jgi:choline dehydrogenase-like flavoprotein